MLQASNFKMGKRNYDSKHRNVTKIQRPVRCQYRLSCKDDLDEQSVIPTAEKNVENKKLIGILGFVLSLIGCVLLIVFGAISVFNSEAADKIAGSAVIVIDGNFIAMLISVLFVVFGAVILIRSIKK